MVDVSAEKTRDEATLKIAESDLKRGQNLLIEGAMSRRGVEEQRAQQEQF